MELKIDGLEREILYRALKHYKINGEPGEFVVENMFKILELEEALELPEFYDKR